MASGQGMPVRTGTYTGTGAAKTVVVGHKPKKVLIFNASDPAIAVHLDTMAAASFMSQEDGSTAFVTSQGVTLTDTGFTVGTNAQINASGDTIHWEATA